MAVKVVECRVRRACEVLWAGTGDDFRCVARCTRVVCAFKQTVADALDVDVLGWFRLLDAKPAVGAAEEVVAALVGELDFAVLQDDGRIGWQKDGAVKQPPGALWIDVRTPLRNDDGVAFAPADGCLNAFVVSQTCIIIDSFHGMRKKYC